MNNRSELLVISLGILYPFILIVGIYITLNGYLSPGGGFQGGAVLSALYICKYLSEPIEDTKLDRIQRLEKVVLVFIILLPVSFLFYQLNTHFPQLNAIYLVVMNALISLKVACGFILIFFRFVFYEVR